MFSRPHHQRIAQALEQIDSARLKAHRCFFGGGTAIALAHGEYRESVDIDLICDAIEGYRDVRTLVDQHGLDWVFKGPMPLARAPRVDQYGIRSALVVDGVMIKFEIVFEGRITLAQPLQADRICGVWRLTDADLVATKLMANTDRWADAGVMSRDIIDLAMMIPAGKLPLAGVDKAVGAYGPAIVSAFAKSKDHLLNTPGRLRACMQSLRMDAAEGAVRAAVDRLNLPKLRAATAGARSGGSS